jgi:hypothetical protein
VKLHLSNAREKHRNHEARLRKEPGMAE